MAAIGKISYQGVKPLHDLNAVLFTNSGQTCDENGAPCLMYSQYASCIMRPWSRPLAKSKRTRCNKLTIIVLFS